MLSFSSRELFVIRKIVTLFNDEHIEREKDIMQSERGIHTINFVNVKAEFSEDSIKESVLKSKKDEKKAFLRGVFLGCGIVSSPPNYHLELRFEKSDEENFISLLLSQFKIKHSSKPNRIFIKGRENIKDFFYVIGANNAYIELEEDAANKEVSNLVNRLANFEFANLERQTNSFIRDKKIIESLINSGEIEKLDPQLKEIALLRLQFPGVSLKELSKKTGGKYSKQEIYYRLKKIKEYGKQKQDKA